MGLNTSPGLRASTLGKVPRRLHLSLVAMGGWVTLMVGCAPLSPPGARAYSPSNPDSQVGRCGRTPGWMVLHPAGVMPLGTNSWALAQLKSTSCPKGFLQQWGRVSPTPCAGEGVTSLPVAEFPQHRDLGSDPSRAELHTQAPDRED